MFNTTLSQMRPKKKKKKKKELTKMLENKIDGNTLVQLCHGLCNKMVYLYGLTRMYYFYCSCNCLSPSPSPFSLSLFQLIIFSLYFDLILQYSVFSSLLTLGATISGVTSGRTTDLIGPRGVSIMTLQLAPGLL